MSLTNNYTTTSQNSTSSSTYTYTNTGTTAINDSYLNYATIASNWTACPTISEIVAEVLKELDKKNEKESKMKENKYFGKITSTVLKFSLYGIAIKNKEGKFVSYDTQKNKLIDVSDMIFDFDCFFKMPKAIKDIVPGDIILHMGNPIFVYSINDNNRIIGLDPVAGEERIVLPTSSPFGFDYVLTVINPFANNNPTQEQPFGNLLPLMCADNDSMLPYLMMMNQNKKLDPMMLLLMSKDKTDIGELFMMMNMMNANEAH